MSASPPDPRLRQRTIVLVGLMGVGKTSVGRRLAAALELPFRDADAEIEAAAGRPVADIFQELGEQAFREGERRVIARLITQEPPHVLATGGGAFLCPQTRAVIQVHAISVWLKADLPVLARRVGRRDTRPLVQGRDPLDVLEAQARDRYPAYAQAAIKVDTGDVSHNTAVAAVLKALAEHVERSD